MTQHKRRSKQSGNEGENWKMGKNRAWVWFKANCLGKLTEGYSGLSGSRACMGIQVLFLVFLVMFHS